MRDDLVERLRARADQIVEVDCAVIEAGGEPNPQRARDERLLREAADALERERANDQLALAVCKANKQLREAEER